MTTFPWQSLVLLVSTVALDPLVAQEPLPPGSQAEITATPGKPQELTSPDQVPEGLAKSDWSSIRAAYDAGQHAFQPIKGGWQARNPGQQWTTKFDGRGFIAQPRGSEWEWGLELKSYGFTGQEHPISGQPAVKADGQRLSYDWDATVQEWFVNDTRGLEHGFTVAGRPQSTSFPVSSSAPLAFTLATRGTLTPQVTADALGVEFRDAAGVTVLNYTGLKVWDADGKVLASRFEAAGHKSLRLLIDEHGARYPLTIDPIAQQAYLKPAAVGTTQVGDYFGYSVAVSGDTVVVGSYGEASSTTGINGTPDELAGGAGAAYVFVRSGTTWSQQAYLKPAAVGTTQADDAFGYSVAVSGNTIVVGAYQEDSGTTGINNTSEESASGAGAAYVFVRSGTTWSQQAYLKASQVSAGDRFGWSVAVSGDTVVVGAPYEDSSSVGINSTPNELARNAGAAYVFVRSGTTWSQQAYLKHNIGTTRLDDYFGNSVAVSGDTIVVGAYSEDSSSMGINSTPDELAGNAGAAYVFVRNGTTWSQQAYLKASQVNANDYFGASVAVGGDTVVVGSYGEASSSTGINSTPDELAGFAGAAHVFVRSGTTWSQQAYLKASQVTAGDLFGESVAVSGNTVVVGAAREASNTTGINSTPDELAGFAGAAYVFVRSGTTWSQQAYLKSSQVNPDDFFGNSVAVSGDTVVVGAFHEDSSTTGINSTPDELAGSAGAAYIFTGLGLEPDIVVTQVDAVANGGNIDCGPITLGNSSAPLTFTLTNPGSADLTDLTVTGGTADFTVSALSSTTVTPGGPGVTFNVTFTPGAVGPRTTTLQIASNVIGSKNPYYITLTGTGISTNADLSGLVLSSGSLDPTFTNGTVTYTSRVANATSSLTVTPTRAEANATIEARVNDGSFAPVSSGSPSGSLALNVGANMIDVRVTSHAGNTKTYTITVTRDKSGQLITFAPSSAQLATASLLLDATGGASGQPIVFFVESGPALVGEGNILTFTGAGEVRVRASQAGNSDFNPADDVTHTFEVVLPQPDVAVGLSLDSLVGIRSYGNSGQQLNLVSRFARPVTGFATLANRTILSERRAADRLAVRANPGNRFFRVTYSDVDGNATAGIVSGFYRTPAIDGTDAMRWLTARISPSKALLAAKKGKRTKTFRTTVRASSTLYPPASDAGVIQVLHR
jgi:hypothetical protein